MQQNSRQHVLDGMASMLVNRVLRFLGLPVWTVEGRHLKGPVPDVRAGQLSRIPTDVWDL